MNEYRDTPCAQWQEKLAILPPDTLSPSDQKELEAHLRSCPVCISVYRQYHELSIALSHISAGSPPVGFPPLLFQYWQEIGLQISSQPSQENKKFHQASQRRFSVHAYTKRLTVIGVLAAVLLVGVVLSFWLITQSSFIGGKGGGSSSAITTSWADHITFAPSISYDQALRLITDLGLQPSLECAPGRPAPGTTEPPEPVWQPVGQKETFPSNHQLQISPTFSAPLDWRLKLKATPGVLKIASQWSYCPHVVFGTPSPGIIMPLRSDQAGADAYVRITFNASQTYDEALYTVSNLGLGLANYCYEQTELAAGRGPTPPWQFTSEEQPFIKTHTLVVTTRLASSLWQTQVQSQPGVVSIATPYTHVC